MGESIVEQVLRPPKRLLHRDGELRITGDSVEIALELTAFRFVPNDEGSRALGVVRTIADSEGRLHRQTCCVRVEQVWTSISGKTVATHPDPWVSGSEQLCRSLVTTTFLSDSREQLVFLVNAASGAKRCRSVAVVNDHLFAGELEVLAFPWRRGVFSFVVKVTDHSLVELTDGTELDSRVPLFFDLERGLLWHNMFDVDRIADLIETRPRAYPIPVPIIFSATDEYREEPQPGVEFVLG